MAPRTSKFKKAPKKAKKSAGLRKRKPARKTTNVPEWASLSCKRSLAVSPTVPTFNSNTLYSLMNTQLLDYPRALTVAQGYQFFRIKSICLTIKPTFDSYIAAAGAVSKPNFYYMIDKSGALPTNLTLEALKQMGAKGKQLDEKNMRVTWKPSVLEGVMYANGGSGALAASRYKISPWLATTALNVSPSPVSASGVDHLGIYWYVDQLSNPIGAQYTVEVEAQFEFKKPNTSVLLSDRSAEPAIMATLNTSPDGVVGGGDGI